MGRSLDPEDLVLEDTTEGIGGLKVFIPFLASQIRHQKYQTPDNLPLDKLCAKKVDITCLGVNFSRESRRSHANNRPSKVGNLTISSNLHNSRPPHGRNEAPTVSVPASAHAVVTSRKKHFSTRTRPLSLRC